MKESLPGISSTRRSSCTHTGIPLAESVGQKQSTPTAVFLKQSLTLTIVSPSPHLIPLAQGLRVSFEVLFGTFAESQSKDFKEEIDDEGSAEDYGYLSDSDLEDDEDEKVTSFKHTSKPKVYPFNPFGAPGGDRKTPCEEHEECTEKGKVVKIPDMAFVT